MNIELIIDPEFVACIPPLSQDEFEQLEENILSTLRSSSAAGMRWKKRWND